MHRRSLATALLVAAFAGCSLAIDTSDLTGGGGTPVDGGGSRDSDPVPVVEASTVPGTDAGADATADAQVEAGPCLDLIEDPKNCGRCGHDCLGGKCSDARCQPSTIITGEAAATLGVAVDATTLYWSRFDGQVRAAKLDGSQKRDLQKLPSAGHIEVDDTYLYVPGFESHLVTRFKKDGSGSVETLAPCEGSCLGIALHNGRVYFTERAPESIGKLRVVESDGGATVLLSNLSFPEDLFAAPTRLLIANEGGGNIIELADGKKDTTVFDEVTDPVSVVADATDIWIVSQNTNTIRRRSLAGGLITIVATLPATPTGLAQDAVSLYWAQDDGTVSRLAK